MKKYRLVIGALLAGVLLVALSFGAKWIIFNTMLENDGTGRQPVAREEP